MNLLQLRTKFVQISGRYDLVIDSVDYADQGADYYINAGMHMLERLSDLTENKARLFYALASGEYALTFQHNCRLIQEVWANSSTERFPLEKISLAELKEEYYKLASSEDTGEPAYYAIAELRALETTDQISLGTFIDKNWLEDETKYDYNGIVIVPPADESYVIEISGLFKNVDLSNDSDQNFWTLQESDLLLRAALYKLEAFSRGTENAKNWLSAIRDDVFELNKDLAQEESIDVDQMEG